MATIYHGTPMTPRAALLDVCAGRAMCVSFYRPDDVEVVEAISPTIMFRQRSVLGLASSDTSRQGLGRGSRLDLIFRLAGAATVSTWPVGCHSRYARCAVPAQRRASERMAVRTEGLPSMAHGRADRATCEAVRAIRPRLSGVDRPEGGVARLSRADDGSGQGFWKPLAGHSHAARRGGGFRLPLRQCGQHLSSSKWMAL